MFVHTLWHEKFRVLRPTIRTLGELNLLFTQGFAMSAGGVLLMRSAVADMAFDANQARPVVDALGARDRVSDPLAIIGIADPLDVPTIGEEPPGDVLAEGECCVALDRDVIAVVDPAQVAEPQMTGERRRLAAHSLHHAAITAQREDVVIEQRKTWFVEIPRQPIRCDRHADAGRNPLAQRSRRRLDTRGQVILRMAWTFAAELAEMSQIVERDGRRAEPLVIFVDRFDPSQMKHRIEEGRGMPRGQHETIAV